MTQGSPFEGVTRYTVLLTGLPCSGKSTIGSEACKAIRYLGGQVVHLDGDEMRKGLCSSLGFSLTDRHENIRRVAHTAKLFNDAGVMVVASFVCPLEEYRQLFLSVVDTASVVYVKCSSEQCEKRDVKGMWAKARLGQIKGFTGIDSDYQPPVRPDMTLDTEFLSVKTCTAQLVLHLAGWEGAFVR